MYCVKCGENIPDNSKFCNICGYKIAGQSQVYFVKDISVERDQIAIESNDSAVIEACHRFHSECNYQLAITDMCFNIRKNRIQKDPALLYFITLGLGDFSMMKALNLPLDKISINRNNFKEKLRSFLILNGYQKQPAAQGIWIKNI